MMNQTSFRSKLGVCVACVAMLVTGMARAEDEDDWSDLFRDDSSESENTAASPAQQSAQSDAAQEEETGDAGRADEEREQEPQEEPEEPRVIVLPEDPDALPPLRAAPRQIDEIVVTATKVEQNVRDIPATITALRGEDLEAMGYQDADDFVKLTPGVNISGGGRPGDPKRITVRGVSNISGTTMTTGTFWGDVPFSDPFIARVTLDPNAFDLETVEVLKGPQGTLFGASALNGAIRYVPRAPEFGEWELKSFARYTSIEQGGDGWTGGGVGNIPLGGRDDLALRVTGFVRKEPGVIDETGRGERDVDHFEQHGARGALRWAPSDLWQVDLQHVFQDSSSADSGFADGLDGTLERDSTPQASPSSTQYQISSVMANRSFGWGELVTQTARTAKTFDTFNDISRNLAPPTADLDPGAANEPIAQFIQENESQSFVHETRAIFAPEGSPWHGIAGVFGTRARLQEIVETTTSDETQPPIPINPLPLGAIPGLPPTTGFVSEEGQLSLGHTDFDVVAKELALFGQVKRSFGPSWEASLSGRLFRTEVGGTIINQGAVFATTNTGDPVAETNAEIIEEGFNPAMSVTWRPAEELMTYLAASRGFRFGGINALANDATVDAPLTYSSDRIDNFELGLRSRWLDGSLQLDGTVFFFLWDEPQLFQAPEMGFSQYVTNVGAAEGEGVEMALVWLPPLDGLTLSLSAAYTETRTTEPFTEISGQEIEPGTLWPFSPRFQSSSTLEYRREFGAWQATLNLVHAYLGRSFTDLTQEDQVFDYHTLDLGMSLARGAGWPQLDLTAGNLTDERGLSALQSLSNPDGSVDYFPNYIRPRSVSLKLSFEF